MERVGGRAGGAGGREGKEGEAEGPLRLRAEACASMAPSNDAHAWTRTRLLTSSASLQSTPPWWVNSCVVWPTVERSAFVVTLPLRTLGGSASPQGAHCNAA